eukprot:3012879-Prymnesium_polylepis.1
MSLAQLPGRCLWRGGSGCREGGVEKHRVFWASAARSPERLVSQSSLTDSRFPTFTTNTQSHTNVSTYRRVVR